MSKASNKVELLEKPKEFYYITKNKPSTLWCSAKNAKTIEFTCNGTKLRSKKNHHNDS